MVNVNIIRTISALILSIFVIIQIFSYFTSLDSRPMRENSGSLFSSDFTSSSKIKLPTVKQQYPKHLINWAENYLKMPVWSKGYHRCDTEESEVSCFELYRAAKIIEHWENQTQNGETKCIVYVNITNESFYDRLSMLYHGFQIAIFSNRALYVNKDLFLPIKLPNSIKHVNEDTFADNFCVNCFEIQTNYKFGCFDVKYDKDYNITFRGASYPQVLYNHHLIGCYLYENFGFHSAHFIGNYLFGSFVKPVINNLSCELKSDVLIEGWEFDNESRFSKVSDFHKFAPKCNQNPNDFHMEKVGLITNSNINESELKFNEVRKTYSLNDEYYESSVCALYSLMSAKWIIATFGSRLGFWASALLGSKSAILNTYDLSCVNLTFSQQGSLFHTESPPDLKGVFRINDHFYPCGKNQIVANRYLENLLW